MKKNINIVKIYYLLAFIDIFLLTISLIVNHNLTQKYKSFVDQESKVAQTQEKLEKLSDALNNLNRPGNNIFITKDIKDEKQNLEIFKQKLNEQLEKIETNDKKIISMLDLFKDEADALYAIASNVLKNFNEDKVRASELMAKMDAQYFECSETLSQIRRFTVSEKFTSLKTKSLYSQKLFAYEIALGSIIFLVVIGIVIYGRRLSKEIENTDSFKDEASNIRSILDKTAIISITDINGIIVDANQNFSDISKYEINELIGKNSNLLKSGYHSQDFWQEFWHTIKDKKTWRGEIKNKAKDGSYYWVDTSIIPEFDKLGNIKFFHSIRYDITEKKKLEEDLIYRNKLVNSIGDIQQRFLQGSDDNSIFELLLAEILKITDSEYGYIGEVLYKDGDPFLKTKSITDISWNEETSNFYKENAPLGLEFYNLNTLFGHVLKYNENVISNNPSEDKRASGIPPGHPALDRYLGIALQDEGKLIGSVGIANKKGGYTEDDIKFLSPYLDTCTLLIKAIKDKREIVTSKEQAVAASLAKSSFLSSMSHEMRTPLNAILGIVQLLQSKIDKNEIKEDFNVIESSSQSLLNLVNDILDISKIESGAITVLNESFNLHSFTEDLFNMFKTQANLKQLNFELIKDTDLPKNLKGDIKKIKQILVNLIANAIKFTTSGFVKVRVNYNDEFSLLNFHIEDTGIGIESEKIDNVFEVFHQEDGRISRDFGGTGLGLSISKKLAEALGGDILVVSEKHKGSTFSFRCRCEEVKGAEAEKDKSVIKDFEIQNFSVLVAEDNELNMKIIKRLLEKIGVCADFVYNGSEALEKTKINHYDIIFMDMMMPVMDGLEATKSIKSASQGATPYIIACTANAIETEIEKCFSAGMDDFLSKPIMIDQLKKTINKALLSKESVS